MSKSDKPIIREVMGYDAYLSVGIPGVKKVDARFDEVIPIVRHKDEVYLLGRS